MRCSVHLWKKMQYLDVFGRTKFMSQFGCMPVLQQNSADKLGMCSDLWEGPWEFHNYADLSPTATSGHVLTDIPKLLKDAQWEAFSSCVCLHYLSFFLSSQSYANTLEKFQRLLLWMQTFFFLTNLSTIGAFSIVYFLLQADSTWFCLVSAWCLAVHKPQTFLNTSQHNCSYVLWCCSSQDHSPGYSHCQRRTVSLDFSPVINYCQHCKDVPKFISCFGA